MDGEIAPLLRLVTLHTGKFLSECLPDIGGENWWRNYVLNELSEGMARRVEAEEIMSLDGLDLAALVRVFDRSWFEIARERKLRREDRLLVKELANIRNRLAHQGACPQRIADQARDVDTITRYLDLIAAPTESLTLAEQTHRRLLSKMLGQMEPAESAADDGDQTAQADTRPETISGPADENREDLVPRLPLPEGGHEQPPANGDAPASIGGAAVTILDLATADSAWRRQVEECLAATTYIGIDFGTSTTVVSYVRRDAETSTLIAEPMAIAQFDELGRRTDSHLVPTCVAWTNGKLLVGTGAAQTRVENTEGRDVWTGFKMKLGVDLGPEYPHTLLPEGGPGPVIERPQDAAREFFRFLRDGIAAYLTVKGLPPDIRYAVSVPASFEANQRQDLANALESAGIDVAQTAFIDEPNAAFVSYVHESVRSGGGALAALSGAARKVLVFDFGAGTCDISLLKVSLEAGRLRSRNLAVSRFLALGGGDIDREIARQVLINQLERSGGEVEFTTHDLDTVVIPRLAPAAEALKVQCCKLAESRGLATIDELSEDDRAIQGRAIRPFTLRKAAFTLTEPIMTPSDFAEVMEPFLEEPEESEGNQRTKLSIFNPIFNAIEKARITESELDMVLFIGGSCENPVVREAVRKRFGRFVECVVPRDLRSHVSQGAALHSLMVNGFDQDIVQPITSEPIFVVTRGGGLRELIPASTPVPTSDFLLSELSIQRDGQERIELPICVSSPDKLLGVVAVNPGPGQRFEAGMAVRIGCGINREKMLRIHGTVGRQKFTARLLNPRANQALNRTEIELLQARQALNESILAGGGRPSVAAVLMCAYAAAKGHSHRLAAEMFEAAERLDPVRDFATNICYHYDLAGEERRSARWAERSYERKKTAVAAFNLALTRKQQGNERRFVELMEEALSLDPEEEAALECYGHHLVRHGDPRGMALVTRGFELLWQRFDAGVLPREDYPRLTRAADTLGRTDVLDAVAERRKAEADETVPFDDNVLVDSDPTRFQRREA